MLKAVLFDLDDTLIDWSHVEDDWETRDAAYSRGVYNYISTEVQPLDDFEGYLHEFRVHLRDAWATGRGSLRSPNLGDILCETLVAVGVPSERIDLHRCLEAYGWKAAPGLTAFPDVPPVLDLLRDHRVRVGIVTNAHMPMWLRDHELDQLALLDYFPDCRVSAADAGYLKPHPGIFRLALDALDVTADEVVFVGDNPIADIAGAQGAGLKAVLRQREAMDSLLSGIIEPDARVESLEELPPLLDEWFPGWR